MIYLNVGNLWDNEYLDTVIKWNEEFKDVQVKALFGSISGLTPTARSRDRLPYRGYGFVRAYTEKAMKHDISIRYTLNQSCIGAMQDFKTAWDNSLKVILQELHSMGIHEWTVTSPLVLGLLRQMFPDDFLEVSTIAEVATGEEAARWVKLRADGVNVSTAINRDFPAIREVAKSGLTTSILANEACLYRCAWRKECYNLSSHDSERSAELFAFYPFRDCTLVRELDPVEWIKARLILPQWMQFYKKRTGVHWFKIAYRTHPKETALPILRAYMEQLHNGNLLDLWPTISHLGNTPPHRSFISCEGLDELRFIQNISFFGHRCKHKICGQDCKYCYNVYQKMLEKGYAKW